jgi:hypothetical protein
MGFVERGAGVMGFVTVSSGAGRLVGVDRVAGFVTIGLVAAGEVSGVATGGVATIGLTTVGGVAAGADGAGRDGAGLAAAAGGVDDGGVEAADAPGSVRAGWFLAMYNWAARVPTSKNLTSRKISATSTPRQSRLNSPQMMRPKIPKRLAPTGMNPYTVSFLPLRRCSYLR